MDKVSRCLSAKLCWTLSQDLGWDPLKPTPSDQPTQCRTARPWLQFLPSLASFGRSWTENFLGRLCFAVGKGNLFVVNTFPPHRAHTGHPTAACSPFCREIAGSSPAAAKQTPVTSHAADLLLEPCTMGLPPRWGFPQAPTFTPEDCQYMVLHHHPTTTNKVMTTPRIHSSRSAGGSGNSHGRRCFSGSSWIQLN